MAEETPQDRLPGARTVTFQPEMAAGLNGTELILAISAGFAALFAVTLLTWPILGAGHFALLAGALSGAVVGYAMRVFIVVLKRQRPEGYVAQVVLAFRHHILPHEHLIARDGHWDFYRHNV